MAGLAGLSPLAGFVREQAFATPEQRSGDPADPRHARRYWAAPERMPWHLRAWALAPVSPVINPGLPDTRLGNASQPAGTMSPGTPYMDATPYGTHAAPWPKGAETTVDPDAVARRLEQSAVIHGTGLGGSQQKWLQIAALQDRWVEVWNPGPETPTVQAAPPQQVAMASAGWGSTDRVGNPRGVNDHDFQNAHLHRRYAAGSIPGNYMWMKPGGRPLVKSVPGPARPAIGPASPYEGQDLAVAFGVQGAVLQQPAADYEAPPDPYTAPPLSQQRAIRPGPVRLW